MNRVDYRWPFKLFCHAAVAKPCLADCDSQRLSSHSETSKSREIFWNSIRIKKVACSSTGLRVCRHSRQGLWGRVINSCRAGPILLPLRRPRFPFVTSQTSLASSSAQCWWSRFQGRGACGRPRRSSVLIKSQTNTVPARSGCQGHHSICRCKLQTCLDWSQWKLCPAQVWCSRVAHVWLLLPQTYHWNDYLTAWRLIRYSEAFSSLWNRRWSWSDQIHFWAFCNRWRRELEAVEAGREIDYQVAAIGKRVLEKMLKFCQLIAQYCAQYVGTNVPNETLPASNCLTSIFE